MAEETLSLQDPKNVIPLFGPRDSHLRLIEERYDVSVVSRNGALRIIGEDEEDVNAVRHVLKKILSKINDDQAINQEIVEACIDRHSSGQEPDKSEKEQWNVRSDSARVDFEAFTPGQADYIKKMRNHTLVFSIGPAGTGKTFLGVAVALEHLWNDRVDRIVLARPAVEAGEELGFLPGDIEAKVNPYLRPLYDSLRSLLEYEKLEKLISNDVVEIVPLAFMRGRTLDDAFVILDEAQNTTTRQMRMFLTRMGRNAKMVVTGDVTQIDLPRESSGLVQIQHVLDGISDIAFAYLEKRDVVRHPLVQKIIDAYEEEEENN